MGIELLFRKYLGSRQPTGTTAASAQSKTPALQELPAHKADWPPEWKKAVVKNARQLRGAFGFDLKVALQVAEDGARLEYAMRGDQRAGGLTS